VLRLESLQEKLPVRILDNNDALKHKRTRPQCGDIVQRNGKDVDAASNVSLEFEIHRRAECEPT
jgi:hypothetical protein